MNVYIKVYFKLETSSSEIKRKTSLKKSNADSSIPISRNSFGYGGTNAHAIIDGAGGLPSIQSSRESISIDEGQETQANPRKPHLFLFSSHDQVSHNSIRKQLNDHLESSNSVSSSLSGLEENAFLENLSFTLGERRSRFNWKSYAIASTIKELSDAISAPGFKPTRSNGQPRIAFVFTGQGAQWAQMGVQLMKYPVFKESVESAELFLRDGLGSDWSVLEELERGDKDSKIQLAKFSQPLCTIVQVALVDLFQKWNIAPTGVVGHSSGEIAAAYCSGAISRQAAWEISYWRGKLCSDLSTKAPHLRGAMMAAGLSFDVAQGYIE